MKIAQTIWHCQYHIVWVWKYRFRILQGEIAREVDSKIPAAGGSGLLPFPWKTTWNSLPLTLNSGCNNSLKVILNKSIKTAIYG